jgi:hypothetical protein
MKKFFVLSAVAFFATIFAAGTASAQMTYQNKVLNFTGNTQITVTSGTYLKTPYLYSRSVYVSLDGANYQNVPISNATNAILGLRTIAGTTITIVPFNFGPVQPYSSKPAFIAQSVADAISGSVATDENGGKHIDYNVDSCLLGEGDAGATGDNNATRTTNSNP